MKGLGRRSQALGVILFAIRAFYSAFSLAKCRKSRTQNHFPQMEAMTPVGEFEEHGFENVLAIAGQTPQNCQPWVIEILHCFEALLSIIFDMEAWAGLEPNAKIKGGAASSMA